MSNYYAQIDTNNTVIGISELHSEETYDHLISIASFDATLLGKVYDATNKVFNDPVLTLDQVKQNKLAELDQAYVSAFTTFQSSATGVLKTYPFDSTAQGNLSDLQTRLIADPNKNAFYFKTLEDGILLLHTKAQFLQLLDDAELCKVNLTNKFEIKDKQRTTCTTIDQVNSIVWNDTTAPVAPVGLAGTAGTASASLAWTANGEIDVQIGGGYNVYQAGKKINTSIVTNTSYAATGLTSGAAVSFTITAVDSDGNESTQSNSVTVTPN